MQFEALSPGASLDQQQLFCWQGLSWASGSSWARHPQVEKARLPLDAAALQACQEQTLLAAGLECQGPAGCSGAAWLAQVVSAHLADALEVQKAAEEEPLSA